MGQGDELAEQINCISREGARSVSPSSSNDLRLALFFLEWMSLYVWGGHGGGVVESQKSATNHFDGTSGRMAPCLWPISGSKWLRVIKALNQQVARPIMRRLEGIFFLGWPSGDL